MEQELSKNGLAGVNEAWAQTLAQVLVGESAEPRDVVISPGSRSAPLALAFANLPQARSYSILDERAAGFFALGLARARRQPVILLCTSGSAGTHYWPAVVEAAASRVPLVIVTADRPVELQHCGAAQTIDQARLFGQHVRFFADLGAPQADLNWRYWRSMAARALDGAQHPVAGPVHLNVPFREPLWAANAPLPAPLTGQAPRYFRGEPRLDEAKLDALARRLADARRGVFVCGPRAPDAGALATTLLPLAARLQWPILAEPTSQLRFGSHARHQVICAYDGLLRQAPWAARHAPDLVVRFGQMPTSKAVGLWLEEHGADRTMLVEPAGQWLDPTHTVDTLVVAEPTALCLALAQRLPHPAPEQSPWLSSWQRADARAAAVLQQHCAAGFWSGAVARMVVESLGAGASLHVASSMAIRDIDSFAPGLSWPVSVSCNRGTNGIDGTLACFLGGAAGAQEGAAVALLGDLAFLHDVGALQLARQLPPRHATAVVVNNQGGGIFDMLPVSSHTNAFERLFRTPQLADIEALCAAAAVAHTRAEERDGLRDALRRSAEPRARPGLQVIEARVEVRSDARYAAAWRAVARAVSQDDSESNP